MSESRNLQDYIFMSKYARTVNGKKESWDEAVDRVMGMHREFLAIRHGVDMQQIEPYLKLADAAYRDQVTLGAQRALQWGGSQLLKHHFRLYNCFREDTRFVTSEGVRSFEDFVDGDQIKVLTHKNNWKKAIVKNYGRSSVNKITIKRSSNTFSVYATGDHRWIRNDGTFTDDIQVNDKLLRTPRYFEQFDYNSATPFEKLYWCYGLVFGDGTKVKYNGEHAYSMIRLCGHDKQFAERFEECGFKTSTNLSLNGDFYAYTGTYLKTTPDPKVDSPELIRAFVSGYLQADAYKDNNINAASKFIDIQCSNEKHFDFIRECFPVAGVYIISERNVTHETTNYGERANTIKFRLTQGQGSMAGCFKVIDIEKDVETCDVWCLEVEDDQSFMLPNGLATGNCAASYANRVDFFSEILYVLLCGAGCGYSVQKHHVDMMPKVKGHTGIRETFVVQDSIEGWADAMKALSHAFFYKRNLPEYDFSLVREKGAPISGGFKAPGPEPLKIALDKIKVIFKSAVGRKLKPIEVHEITCILADAVISGGVRRSALLSLFSVDDEDMITCKTGDWWTRKEYLGRANNSAAILPNTPYEDYQRLFDSVKQFGEPGIVFLKDKDQILNPCAEISMYPVWVNEDGTKEYGFSVCNLTEINGSKITSQEKFNEAAVAGAILGTIQASYTDFPYLGEVTQNIIRRDALIGVGITGMCENPDILFNPAFQTYAAGLVCKTNKEVADIIGISFAARTTTIKPSGTTSALLGTSSGIHPFHSKRFIRHVQANKMEQAYQITKEFNSASVEDSISNDRDGIIAFPIEKTGNIITKKDQTALQFLQSVKLTQNNWILAGTNWDHPSYLISPDMTHNVSNTCFSKKERFITTAGIRAFGDFSDGDKTEVFDYEGNPRSAIVKNFGVQQIYELVLSDGKNTRTIETTKNHIWLAASLRKRTESTKYTVVSTHVGYKMITTEKLEDFPNVLIPRVIIKQDRELLDDAFCHGYVFGDGSKHYKHEDWSSHVKIYDSCRETIADVFEKMLPTCSRIDKEDHIYIGKLPSFWKTLPDSSASPDYIFSFISGWFAADGSVANLAKGQRYISIVTKQKEHIDWLYENAVLAGISVNPYRVFTQKMGYKPGEEYYNLSFVKSSLNDKFFSYHSEKLRRWIEQKDSTQPSKFYKVISVNPTNRFEDVFCVVEPETSTFLLEGGILTHNCTVSSDTEWVEVQEYLWENREFFCGVSFLPASGDLDYPQAPFSEVIDEKELAERYGAAAILAGGLNVDGIHAFGNLWVAINTALDRGEQLKLDSTDISKEILKGFDTDYSFLSFSYFVDGVMVSDVNAIIGHMQSKLAKKTDWVRRFKKFADKYLDGDLEKTGHCLKQVSLLHKWQQIKDQEPINWTAMEWEDISKEAGSEIGANCSGGKCEIILT